MKNWKLFNRVLWVVLGVFPVVANAGTDEACELPKRPLNDFNVLYEVKTRGFTVGTAVWSVKPVDESTNRFHVELTTKGIADFLYPVGTSSDTLWEYTEDGWVRPLRFEYIHSRRKNRHLKVLFDWSSAMAQVTFRGEERQEPLSDRTYDNQVILLELGIRAAAGEKVMRFETIGNKSQREREAKVIGEDVLETESGLIPTIRIYYEDGFKQTTIWYSKDHQLLPVLIEYVDKGGDKIFLHAIRVTIGGGKAVNLNVRVSEESEGVGEKK